MAIEFHSYSKTAGFTGVRCGYTIVPKELKAKTLAGEEVALNPIWDRRQCTKFNGTSYISQRAAEAIYTPEGKEQVKATIAYYMENARLMRETLTKLGLKVYGGENAPYIWVKTPGGTDSWRFFEQMLYGANVVYAGCRFRTVGRRLHPSHRIRRPRRLQRGHAAHRQLAPERERIA